MRKMQRFSRLVFALALAIAQPVFAFAECQGRDLRETLGEDERSALQSVVEQTPFASGNHWRATRDGKIVHLIGTIHLSDARLTPIVSRLRGIIEASGLLLLEVSQAEEDALKADMLERPELLFLQEHTLPELLEEAEWQALSSAMQARGVPPIIASRFQPWYLSLMLGIPPCLTQKFQENQMNGLDHRLRDIATNAGIPTQGLEPHDTLFRLFGDNSIEEQIDVMLLGLETLDQSLDMLETVISAYFEENHVAAWEMSRHIIMQIQSKPQATLKALFDEMEEDLLFTRNRAWIPVITKSLETRNMIAVAAGAGHLGGENGVLALLEAKGFTLERMPF